MIRAILLAGAVLASAVAHAQSFDDRWRRIMIRPPDDGPVSWFTDRQTASGERLMPWARGEVYQCASPDEPMGTRLRVCNGPSCITCRIVDRGPNKGLRRPLDLPPAGFKALGFRLGAGVGRVTIDRE